MPGKPKPIFADAERALSVVVALCSAVVAVTCAASGELAPSAPGAAPPTRAAPVAQGAVLPPSSAAPVAAPGSATAAPAAPGANAPPALARFQAALAELAAGRRKRHVRILWFGDSHTYADFWTDAVRQPLQKRFGNGGPGYVLIGMQPYRHAGVAFQSTGKWRHEPSAPSTSMKTGDGQFGLLGIRTLPDAADATDSLTPTLRAVRGKARWTILFRAASTSDRMQVRLGTAAATALDAHAGLAGPAGSPIRRLSIEGDAVAPLEVRAGGGTPQLFGAELESSVPGVVVDTLGINGARAATPLAWDDKAWVAEIGARSPDLVVLAYGTNEIAETRPVERYAAHYRELLARIRRAAPQVDCLMAGPTDWDEPDGSTKPRVIEIDRLERAVAGELGCRYFSVFDAMGGDGSHTRWEHASPSLGAPDHIHLTPAGYAKLGALVVKALLDGYPAL